MDYYEAEENFTPTKIIGNTDVTIVETSNYQEKIKSYTDKGYIIIGTALFKGIWEPRAHAVQTAQQFGATVVVIHSVPVGTNTNIYSVPVLQPHVGVYSNGRKTTVVHGVSTGTAVRSSQSTIFEQRATFLALKQEEK
ncbi:MAG: hypothetical protein J5716_03425 [Alphaproteobacteria bacterium]|nr:hypothetical protein [Alphaproteobacteria bacterium]